MYVASAVGAALTTFSANVTVKEAADMVAHSLGNFHL
jgi:hypothetical protein